MALNPEARANATTVVRGLFITITSELISRVTTLPLGVQWRKKDKSNNALTKNNFFTDDEKPIEYKNGVKIKILPYPCNEVAYHLFKFISCEGKLSVVHGYQFILLHKLRFRARFPIAQRLSVPYFLLQSIMDMS